jgi:hypothetical protein
MLGWQDGLGVPRQESRRVAMGAVMMNGCLLEDVLARAKDHDRCVLNERIPQASSPVQVGQRGQTRALASCLSLPHPQVQGFLGETCRLFVGVI